MPRRWRTVAQKSYIFYHTSAIKPTNGWIPICLSQLRFHGNSILTSDKSGSRSGPLGECQIHILNRLVDLRSALVDDCKAINASLPESESNRRLAFLTVA